MRSPCSACKLMRPQAFCCAARCDPARMRKQSSYGNGLFTLLVRTQDTRPLQRSGSHAHSQAHQRVTRPYEQVTAISYLLRRDALDRAHPGTSRPRRRKGSNLYRIPSTGGCIRFHALPFRPFLKYRLLHADNDATTIDELAVPTRPFPAP
ncbi:unnamed protein product [Ectocarpus sp. 4 AP-2014]